jgi:hypothetical protein
MLLESVTRLTRIYDTLLAAACGTMRVRERGVTLGQGWVGDKHMAFIHCDVDQFIGWGNCVMH